MKKIILLATFAISMLTLQSCYTTTSSFYYERAYVVDFRDYLKDGFMISPTDAGFEYTPLGQLEVNYFLGKKLEIKGDDENLEKGTLGTYFPTSKRIMDKIVDEAKKLGGDGIVCLKVVYIQPTEGNTQPYYLATGVAVKVKR